MCFTCEREKDGDIYRTRALLIVFPNFRKAMYCLLLGPAYMGQIDFYGRLYYVRGICLVVYITFW